MTTTTIEPYSDFLDSRVDFRIRVVLPGNVIEATTDTSNEALGDPHVAGNGECRRRGSDLHGARGGGDPMRHPTYGPELHRKLRAIRRGDGDFLIHENNLRTFLGLEPGETLTCSVRDEL